MEQTNTTTAKERLRRWALVGAALVLGAAGWLGRQAARPRPSRPRLVYSAQGYGGYVAAPARTSAAAPRGPSVRRPFAADPVRPLQDAYNAGRYPDVEQQAQEVIARAGGSRSPLAHRQAAFARQALAYAAARQAVGARRVPELKAARTEFAALQASAAGLPDRGAEPAPPGQAAPTLEAEGAFQHAVCTGALGDGAGAEREYVAFLKQYPDSPLVSAAVLRLERMHGGSLTPAEEAARQAAAQAARKRQEAQALAASLCGPECLAELLRRRGETADVHALAREMGTGDRGTSLAALAAAAKRRGFAARGLALTQAGLAAQSLPVIALVAPGHYVLVESASAQGVTVWDPDARGVGQGGRRAMPLPEWRALWRGTALALNSVRTARR